MAQMISLQNFTGSVGDLSFYKMRGFDQVIVRRKGGPSKKKIKKDPAFELTRRNSTEFGGRSTACSWINKILSEHRPLADYNYTGHLNKLLKPIQEMDTESDWGKRNILFTKGHRLLEGFSLNNKYPLESIIRTPFSFSIFRDTLSAKVDIPALLPAINFFVQARHPMYSFVASLGILPDLYYLDRKYKTDIIDAMNCYVTKSTEWNPSAGESAATTLELSLPANPANESFTLVLAFGIRFGTIETGGGIRQIKYGGAAKILATDEH